MAAAAAPNAPPIARAAPPPNSLPRIPPIPPEAFPASGEEVAELRDACPAATFCADSLSFSN